IVLLAAVVSQHTVAVMVKSAELIDVLPDTFVQGVKDMAAVFMDLHAGLGMYFGVGIAADMRPAVHHQHALAHLAGDTFRHPRAPKTGAGHNVLKILKIHKPQYTRDSWNCEGYLK